MSVTIVNICIWGLVGFVIDFGGVCYRIRILVYFACILKNYVFLRILCVFLRSPDVFHLVRSRIRMSLRILVYFLCIFDVFCKIHRNTLHNTLVIH